MSRVSPPKKSWKKYELRDGSTITFCLEHEDAADRFFLHNYEKIKGVTLHETEKTI